MKRQAPNHHLRARIAQEAGRMMSELGIRDFALAKRKAVDHLGLGQCRDLPSNLEIEAAKMEYQRLFRSDVQPIRLDRLRRTAVDAMRMLSRFSPALVGPVLSGSADEHSPVNLHVFAETPEELAVFLLEQRIPSELDERLCRFGGGLQENYPLYRFIAGEVTVELTVFPRVRQRGAPLSPVTGKPMRRAWTKEVEELVEEDA